MSKINPPADRPIPTNEPKLESQQASETESIEKTDIAGKAPFDAEQVAKEHIPSTDEKGQQYESRLGGLARQAEFQSQFPIPSSPTLKDLPDANPNLDPNVHLDEKIDVTKNLPDGRAINKGLEGLDWGKSKAKTGPNHMGVDLSTGGMKAPTDRIAEVLNDGKLNQPNTSAPQKGDGGTAKKSVPGKSDGSYSKSVDGGNVKSNSSVSSEGKGSLGTPPPGEASFRAPNMSLVGSSTRNTYPGGHDVTTTTKTGTRTDYYVDGKDKAVASVEKSIDEGVTTTKLYGENGVYKGKDVVSADGTIVSYDKDGKQKKYTDPDAAGGGDVSAEDIARKMKGRLGQVEHGINPDLGVSGGPTGSGELKHPIDLLSDPIDEGELSVEHSTPEKAKLAADIHGPRTVNPDSGFGGVKPDIKGGADPVPNQGEDID